MSNRAPGERPPPPPPTRAIGRGRAVAYLPPAPPLGRGNSTSFGSPSSTTIPHSQSLKEKMFTENITELSISSTKKLEKTPDQSSHQSLVTSGDGNMQLPEYPPVYFRGESGKQVAVTSNYIKLHLEEGKGIFEYEVKYEPLIDSQHHRFKIINQQRDILGETKVFDGVKLFLPEMLDPGLKNLTSTHPETGNSVKIVLKFIRACKSGDRETLQLYCILFNKIMRTLKFTQHNRNFYDANNPFKIPQYHLEIWPGYVSTVNRYEGGLLLQCDVSHRVLRTESVRDLLLSLVKKDNFKNEAEKALLGTSVLTSYNNKTYKIDEVNFDSSPKDTFINEKGEEISYVQYYKSQYSIDIKDLNQPLLLHRVKKKNQNEKEVKLICLVPELCMLTGMSDAMRTDFKIMKEVGNYTRASPEQRIKSISKFISILSENQESQYHLKKWGLSLSPETISLKARLLPPENIYFGKGIKEQVGHRADWGRSLTSNLVLTSVPLQKWAIFYLERNKAIVQNFCNIMQKQGRQMGFSIGKPKPISLPNERTDTYLNEIKKIIQPDVQLIVAVVPQVKSDRYAAIKKLCCVEKPVASQVVCLKTISNEKRLVSVVQKIALQINVKLGGELWACESPYEGLMVVGIDVFHDKNCKSGSVAGVVSSLNEHLSRYKSNTIFQKQGQEIVDCLRTAFMDGLAAYWEVNQKWPTNIIIFRDGVGDGQLDLVQSYESLQFSNCFHKIESNSNEGSSNIKSNSSEYNAQRKKLRKMGMKEDYDPGFTFIVVQKRINTKIFSLASKQGSYENPGPGMIVDHTITRFKYKDFYLIPQHVGQGTVTPTHFIIVRENSNPKLKPDDIQKISYKLTHMYFNWSGTVRVPSPCQYAHKLVELVGEHIHSEPNIHLADKLYYL